MWDQTPFDQVERALACFVVLPNDEKFLAWCRVVAWAEVAHAPIADLKAVDDGEAKRSGALDHTAAHWQRIRL